jgi:gas vesicle protein
MTEEEKNNSFRYAAGLLLGLTTAVAAAFLYKTESGKKLKKILKTYYREAKDHFNKLAKNFSSAQAVDQVVTKEVKKIRKKISLIKKNVFSQSGKPLVK